MQSVYYDRNDSVREGRIVQCRPASAQKSSLPGNRQEPGRTCGLGTLLYYFFVACKAYFVP